MENRPFIDKSVKPSNDTLKKIFGKAFSWYEMLQKLSSDFQSEWNFSRTSGWMLKVHDSKKALYYLIPLENSFIVSLTLREAERNLFIKINVLSELHTTIKDARKFSEGYALKFKISDAKEYKLLSLLLSKIKELR